MAGVANGLPPVPSERGQMLALLEMRWRIFRRSMRRDDAKISFVLYVLGRLLVLAFAAGVGCGCGAIAWYGYTSRPHVLLVLFTTLLLGWQSYSLLRGALSNGVEVELHRFPLRLRTYIVLWLSAGALEAMTIIGGWACLGVFVGLAVAGASFVVSGAVVLLYFLMNLLLTRVLFLWLGRLLAKRRTREFVLILCSLMGLLPRLLQSEFGHAARWLHRLPIPAPVFVLLHWMPPYLAVHTLAGGADAPARALGLLVWTALPGTALVYALRRVYRGEEVQEFAASSAPKRLAPRRVRADRADGAGNAVHIITAMEWDRLRHSGAAMYQAIAPLLLVLLFTVRLLATGQGSWVLPAAAAYIGLTLRCGNSFGSDGAGAQLWMLIPLPLRTAVEGKNLFAVALYAAQILGAAVLVQVISHRFLWAPILFTACWATCYAALCFAVCNRRSLQSPKRSVDTDATMRRRGAQAGGGWQMLVVMLGMASLGSVLIVLATWLHHPMLAPAAMLPLAAIAVAMYRRSLDDPMFNGDILAAEKLLTEIARSAA